MGALELARSRLLNIKARDSSCYRLRKGGVSRLRTLALQSACVLADQNVKLQLRRREDAYSSCILEDQRGELYTWSYWIPSFVLLPANCWSKYMWQVINDNCMSSLQLAQPARLLLKYTGTEFEDKQYEQGDGEFDIRKLLDFCMSIVATSTMYIWIMTCHISTGPPRLSVADEYNILWSPLPRTVYGSHNWSPSCHT